MTAWLTHLRELGETVGMDRYGDDAAERDRLWLRLVEVVLAAEDSSCFPYQAGRPFERSMFLQKEALAALRAAVEEQP